MLVIHISNLTLLINLRTIDCIFLGYPVGTKGYLCLYFVTKCLYTSRHVIFNESKFPFSTLTSHHSPASSSSLSFDFPWFSNLLYLHSTNQPSVLGPYFGTTPSSTNVSTSTISPSNLPTLLTQSTTPSPNSHSTSLSDPLPSLTFMPISTSDMLPSSVSSLSIPPSDPLPDLSSSQSLTTKVSTNHHPMQTRSKSGISKPNPKLCYKIVLDYTFTEPPYFKVAS